MIKRSSELDMGMIVKQHYDAVFRFCARRVGMERAADVSQETFLTAYKVLKNFRGESSLSTWLFGIANNECRRESRKNSVQPIQLEIDIEWSPGENSEGSIVDRYALQQALSKLSADHREVVILHEIEGRTYEEAAEILGVPVGTVKSRLHHAFQQLRRSLFMTEEASR